jgi:hypothetical protein
LAVRARWPRRPELNKALLSANRAGDQLVVTKLGRPGRSLEQLIELSKRLHGSAHLVTSDHRVMLAGLRVDRHRAARPSVCGRPTTPNWKS